MSSSQSLSDRHWKKIYIVHFFHCNFFSFSDFPLYTDAIRFQQRRPTHASDIVECAANSAATRSDGILRQLQNNTQVFALQNMGILPFSVILLSLGRTTFAPCGRPFQLLFGLLETQQLFKKGGSTLIMPAIQQVLGQPNKIPSIIHTK